MTPINLNVKYTNIYVVDPNWGGKIKLMKPASKRLKHVIPPLYRNVWFHPSVGKTGQATFLIITLGVYQDMIALSLEK